MAWCRQASGQYLSQCWQTFCRHMMWKGHDEVFFVKKKGHDELRHVFMFYFWSYYGEPYNVYKESLWHQLCHQWPRTWWRHQMETFSALLAICAGNSPVPGEFPAQRPVTRSFDVFFDLHPINGWVNNGEAGDLRRHRVHYDVTVMDVDDMAITGFVSV